MISAAKYLYKYIYKGPDRARIGIENEPTTDDNRNVDEIKQHLNTRYVYAPQSMYRIFGYNMQDRSHAVFWLAVHLPELQSVQFVQGQEQQYLAHEQRFLTTLTAFFELNRLCNEMHARGLANDFTVDPRNVYCYQIPEHSTFDLRHGWTPRKRGGNQIGRMYTVSSRDTERYCLRIFLLNTKGKRLFEDLRSVGGVTYNSFTDAAKVAGFSDDDRQSLQEVARYQSAAAMRGFFVCLLCFCEIVQAQDLWVEFSDVISDG
uniref:Helitron_like_N domain-containing protein n=1 Tax=Haemonchus contortus TaxID=6289 RepID=A0A7I4Z1L5_HAECO